MKRFIFILFLIPTLLYGQHKYYVSTSGSDSNNGLTTSTPWQTLQYAADHATTSGDTIALKRGDTWMTTSSMIEVTYGGTSSSPIVWDGDLWGSGERATVISNRNGDSDHPMIRIWKCTYVTIQNIVFDGDGYDLEGVQIESGYTHYSDPATNHIILQDCTVKNFGTTNYEVGVRVGCNSLPLEKITLLRDSVYDIASHCISMYAKWIDYLPSGDHEGSIDSCYVGYCYIANSGLYSGNVQSLTGCNGKTRYYIFEHNTLIATDSNTTALYVSGQGHEEGHYPDSVTFRYNYIEASMGSLFEVEPDNQGYTEPMHIDLYGNVMRQKDHDGSNSLRGIRVYSGDNHGGVYHFYNNTLYMEDDSRALVDGASNATVIFRNNLVYDVGTRECANYVSNTTHDHNVYYRTTSGNVSLIKIGSTDYYRDDIGTWESTGLADDPQVVSAPSDMHLTSGSPAIGAGTDVGITQDYDGNSYAATPAMGAYEYTEVPTVTTTTVSSISYTTATGGGNVTADNGHSVTARGICWSTSSNPTTSDSHTSDGTGTGSFTSSITGLSEGTTYHVRAYATNSEGTAYGSDVTFTTLSHGSTPTPSHGKMVKHNGKWVKWRGKWVKY